MESDRDELRNSEETFLEKRRSLTWLLVDETRQSVNWNVDDPIMTKDDDEGWIEKFRFVKNS